MTVTEEIPNLEKRDKYPAAAREHDAFDDEWAKNPKGWYERTQRRGPFYRGNSHYYHDERSDDDESYDEDDEVEEKGVTKKVYDLRKIPIKVEDKDDMENNYYKNQLFYESDSDEEEDYRRTEGNNRNDISGKRVSDETAFGKRDVFTNEVKSTLSTTKSHTNEVRDVLSITTSNAKARAWNRGRHYDDDDVTWKCEDV
jgi:hypothetical protein